MQENPSQGYTDFTTEQLREYIVRATSWNQLFPSKEEAFQGFKEEVVLHTIHAFLSNDSYLCDIEIPHPEGNIFYILTQQQQGYVVSYQKLTTTGDVVQRAFYKKDVEPRIDHILARIGNIHHDYTVNDTIFPQGLLIEDIDEDTRTVVRIYNDKLVDEICSKLLIPDIERLEFHLLGKPATPAWENTLIGNHHFPQRIGHKIFSDTALQQQRLLKEYYPELFTAHDQKKETQEK